MNSQLEAVIRYVPRRHEYLGMMRCDGITIVVTAPTEDICAERLLARYGAERSDVKWGQR